MSHLCLEDLESCVLQLDTEEGEFFSDVDMSEEEQELCFDHYR